LFQSYLSSKNEQKYTHPIVIAGDEQWQDYELSVKFAPESRDAQSGILFRYRNDRCYYFFGFQGNKIILKKVNRGIAYRLANEILLDEKNFFWTPKQYYTAEVYVSGNQISASLQNGPTLIAQDSTFTSGKIGLMADIPTRYKDVKVTTTQNKFEEYEKVKSGCDKELADLKERNPKMVLWKKIHTDGFGVGRNLRFGDMNNDDEIDVLIGQVKHHGPKDRNSELSCLTAMTFDGQILWQIGQPDLWKDNLTNDVGFQIHDFDNDGSTEVIYCMNTEIVVADASTGETKYKVPTPINKSGPPHDAFPRILGDCLFFCDVRGTGFDSDMIIKDRYKYFWVFNNKLELLWDGSCKTGHYPFAYDTDNDGNDEIAIGYSLFDHDGKLLFTLDDKIKDHADGVAIVNFNPQKSSKLSIMNAASDEGMLYYDLKGNILKHHQFGHVQNPAVANFRDDLSGLETVSINFWGNQPVQHGSMMLPINWTGKSEEYFVLSASVIEGGLFDGWGRKVVKFPADGHPELCNAVIDVCGDSRDEIIVWDPQEIWIYTQDDNPQKGKLYQPKRNSYYNYSNYQATVSLPSWSK
jgi:hypothetical protein